MEINRTTGFGVRPSRYWNGGRLVSKILNWKKVNVTLRGILTEWGNPDEDIQELLDELYKRLTDKVGRQL